MQTMYTCTDGVTVKNTDEGGQLLANFTARITKETRYVDGRQHDTYFTLEGEQQDPDQDEDSRRSEIKIIQLPEVTISANEFPGMGWVANAWGVQALIYPGSGVKEDLRTAIMLRSKPVKETVYTHTGWTTIGGKDAYLHAGGMLTAKGPSKAVSVQLPNELANYQLPEQPTNLAVAVRASMDLTELLPAHVSYPLLLATYRPVIAPADFACHVTGRTGTFKSEITSLFQSHYGEKMDARHLPGNWSSTANALEVMAYRAKDATFTIDDFIPVGSSWQIRSYHKSADQVIRAQGNQGGRARLTDSSRLQVTYYPRGLIVSSGEETPDGHSVRARMLIMEMTPGETDPKKLTKAQNARPLYPPAMAAWIMYVAEHREELQQRLKDLIIKYRDKYVDVGHSRTPTMLGNLLATAQLFAEFTVNIQAVSQQTAARWLSRCTAAVLEQANMQSQYLQASDPTDVFVGVLRTLFAGHAAHVRSRKGGVPKNPTLLGWTEERSFDEEVPQYKAHGKQIGWADWLSDRLYLDANICYEIVKKHSGGELTLSRQTMFRRLKDSGKLVETDPVRQRNTVRCTCENAVRQVIVLCLSKSLEVEPEKGPDKEEPDAGANTDDGYMTNDE